MGSVALVAAAAESALELYSSSCGNVKHEMGWCVDGGANNYLGPLVMMTGVARSVTPGRAANGLKVKTACKPQPARHCQRQQKS